MARRNVGEVSTHKRNEMKIEMACREKEGRGEVEEEEEEC